MKITTLAIALLAATPAHGSEMLGLGPAAQVAVPQDWDHALDSGQGSWSTPYVRQIMLKMHADMSPPATTWQGDPAYIGDHGGYLDRNYRNFNTTDPGGYFMRHAGVDFWRPYGTNVRSLTEGTVSYIFFEPKNATSDRVEVKEAGADRWWTYGHVTRASGLVVGAHVMLGQPIGTSMAAPNPHCMVSVHTSGPAPAGFLDVPGGKLKWSRGLSAGSATNAETIATRYTMNPLEAYAITRGMPH